MYSFSMIYWTLPAAFVSVGWFLSQPVTLLSSIVIAVMALLGLVTNKFKTNLGPRKVLVMAYALPITYVISALVNQQSFVNTLFGMYGRGFGLITLTALATIMLVAARTSPDMFFGKVIPVFSGLAIVYGSLQAFNLDPLPWKNEYQTVQLTMGNPNFSSALFGLISVFYLSEIFTRKQVIYRVGNFALYVLTFFLIYKTKSLQGNAVAILTALIFVYLYLSSLKIKHWKSLRRIIFVSSGLVFGGLVAFISNQISIFDRPRKFFTIQANTEARLEYWRLGIRMWKDHLFFGVGVDNYQDWSPLYRSPELVRIDGYSVIADKSHNIFIDHFSNGGLLAGIVWTVSCLLILAVALTLIRTELPKNIQVRVYVLTSVVIGYLFQAFISPDQLILALLAFICAGILLNYYYEFVLKENAKTLKSKKFVDVRLVSAFILFVYVLVAGRVISADARVQEIIEGKPRSQAQVEAVIKDWTSKRAVEIVVVNRIDQRDNCTAITSYADLILEKYPRSANAWTYKVLCSNADGKLDQAVSEIEEALKLDPLDTFFLGLKAKLEIARKNYAEAQVIATEILRIEPDDADGKVIQEFLTKQSLTPATS
jgi:O-antigen ligase